MLYLAVTTTILWTFFCIPGSHLRFYPGPWSRRYNGSTCPTTGSAWNACHERRCCSLGLEPCTCDTKNWLRAMVILNEIISGRIFTCRREENYCWVPCLQAASGWDRI